MGFRRAVGVSYTESKNALRANVFNECLRRMSSTVNQKKSVKLPALFSLIPFSVC